MFAAKNVDIYTVLSTLLTSACSSNNSKNPAMCDVFATKVWSRIDPYAKKRLCKYHHVCASQIVNMESMAWRSKALVLGCFRLLYNAKNLVNTVVVACPSTRSLVWCKNLIHKYRVFFCLGRLRDICILQCCCCALTVHTLAHSLNCRTSVLYSVLSPTATNSAYINKYRCVWLIDVQKHRWCLQWLDKFLSKGPVSSILRICLLRIKNINIYSVFCPQCKTN